MTFGQYIRNIRRERGMAQKDLAERAMITTPYLSKIESDKFPPPAEEVVVRIALVLGEDPYELVVKAGKIPEDFQNLIINNREVFEYLKSICLKDKASGG